MTSNEIGGFLHMFVALAGLGSPVGIVLLVAVLTPTLRLLSWERGRPLRAGFFVLAPLIIAASLAIGIAVGAVVCYLIMFGIFADKTVMPWFTFLPGIAIGLVVGCVSGVFVALNGGRLLRYV